MIILNFDDNNVEEDPYPKMYDPDIRDILGNDAIPQEIWRHQDLLIPQVLEECGIIPGQLDDEQQEEAIEGLKLDSFRFCVWSKTKLSQDQSDDALVEAFKKRFGKSLPLHSLDMVFVESLDGAPANGDAEGEEEKENA